jgi:hypothetical protein
MFKNGKAYARAGRKRRLSIKRYGTKSALKSPENKTVSDDES